MRVVFATSGVSAAGEVGAGAAGVVSAAGAAEVIGAAGVAGVAAGAVVVGVEPPGVWPL